MSAWGELANSLCVWFPLEYVQNLGERLVGSRQRHMPCQREKGLFSRHRKSELAFYSRVAVQMAGRLKSEGLSRWPSTQRADPHEGCSVNTVQMRQTASGMDRAGEDRKPGPVWPGIKPATPVYG